MRIIEASFTDAASSEMKSSLLELLEQATTLDTIFEEWFLKRGNRFGLSLAVDDDDTVMRDSFALFFDTSDGTEILSAVIPCSELAKAYPQVAPFNTFVKGWRKQSPALELHELKYESWLKELGFGESYALMSRTGSRNGAIQLMVSFALSGSGIAEACHVDPQDPCYEDDEAALAEEGIDLKDYFFIRTAYQRHPGLRSTMQTIFDRIYCKKAA